jgi:phosphate transport system permease protein
MSKPIWFRKLMSHFAILSICALALCAVLPLVLVFGYVLQQGMEALNWDLLTQLPKPVGESGGGLVHSIVGTLVLIGMASAIGVPLGVFTGVYLSEYAFHRQAKLVRLAVDLLSSVPSVIVGLFVYGLVVVPMKSFSAIAGALALSIILIPTIAKTTEELLKLVPQHIREAGLGLGLPRWKVILRIVLQGSAPGVMTGVILAVARAAGETAPLLLTALNSRFMISSLLEPTSSLTVQIYTYAISPFDDWHRQAWAASVLLVLLILVLNLVTRALLPRRR